MDASSAVVVGFGFSDAAKLTIPPGFGFLVPPGSDSFLLACTFVDQKFDCRIPQGGRLLRAFFGGKAADRLMPAAMMRPLLLPEWSWRGSLALSRSRRSPSFAAGLAVFHSMLSAIWNEWRSCRNE